MFQQLFISSNDSVKPNHEFVPCAFIEGGGLTDYFNIILFTVLHLSFAAIGGLTDWLIGLVRSIPTRCWW